MRHSGEPYSVRSWSLPSRSEIFVIPSSSALVFSTPTSLELVNGVGGSAVMPSSASPDFAWS